MTTTMATTTTAVLCPPYIQVNLC